jgi:hypothetical protein
MFKYLSDLFSSLLNMSVFMNDDSYKTNTSIDEKEVEEKGVEEKEVEEKEVEEKEVEEKEVEEKETGETFEFIEINDADAFDFFITKF